MLESAPFIIILTAAFSAALSLRFWGHAIKDAESVKGPERAGLIDHAKQIRGRMPYLYFAFAALALIGIRFLQSDFVVWMYLGATGSSMLVSYMAARGVWRKARALAKATS